jgi:carbon-monoxide dehydrogenase small subunit
MIDHLSGQASALSGETVSYSLTVNGKACNLESAWIGESLLYVLRERLGLLGSKNACEEGECGSCSVLLDDSLVCSCMILAADAVDARIRTVESMLTTDHRLSRIQECFVKTGAVQCGFCTPGLIVAVHALLARIATPTDLEIREALSGNLCRCTGYGRVIDAVRSAANLSDES